jgi:hypothetical protein
MAPRRTIAHLFLVLALLLTQQALTAHSFAHRAGAADTQDDPSAPGERILCALCVAGAASGSALPSAGHPPFVDAAQTFEPAPITWAYRPPLARAFSARAPPILL